MGDRCRSVMIYEPKSNERTDVEKEVRKGWFGV